MEGFGRLESSEKTIAILRDRGWPETAKPDGDRIIKHFLCNICKKRNERPNVGGDSIRGRNGAPSRKGCVVNGQMIKARDKRVRLPPRHLLDRPLTAWMVRGPVTLSHLHECATTLALNFLPASHLIDIGTPNSGNSFRSFRGQTTEFLNFKAYAGSNLLAKSSITSKYLLPALKTCFMS